MAVKPFFWKSLKKISKDDQLLLDSVYELLPETSARDKLAIEIRKTLMKHLGEKLFYYLDSVQTRPYLNFLSDLPDTPSIAIIGMEPISEKAVLYIDSNLAFLLIDRLLGGQGEPHIENRSLTETEQGVVQYLIMQILAQIWQVCGKSARVHFRFEKFCFSGRDIEKISNGKEPVVELNFKVGIGELSGFVKLIFPKTFIEKTASGHKQITEDIDLPYFLNKTSSYNYLQTTLWADVGRANISSIELSALESGDVIVFDETEAELIENQISGKASLRTGQGESGSLTAKVKPEGKVIKCTIVSA